MNKILAGLSVFLLACGSARADELHVGVVSKVDGDKVSFILFKDKNPNKFLQGGKQQLSGDPMVLTALSTVKVCKASFDPTALKPKNAAVIVGDPITGGLKSDVFAKGDARVRITVGSDNKIVEVLVFEGKKKKKAN